MPSETRRFDPTYVTGIDGSTGGGLAGSESDGTCAKTAGDKASPIASGSNFRIISLSPASLETPTPGTKYRGSDSTDQTPTARGVSCAPHRRIQAMPLAPATRARIEELLASHRVVLFMKGTRNAPQCGFSAATTDRLNALLDDYATVNVLADDEIRQGIKEYGNWPTIPQLYIDSELVGGADIVQSMFDSGELHRVLGVAEPDRTPPAITISDAAVAAIRQALDGAE